MTVKELIKYLSMVKDKNKDVYAWNEGLILPIKSVDLCIVDRVDLNIGDYE